jgi:hemerythrin
MATIAWKEIYETGIVALDKEHQQLVAQINSLFEAIREKRGEDALKDILAMLEDYTENHFQHEEKLLAEYNFPGLAEHQEVHQALRDDVQALKERYHQGSEGLAQELLKFLRVWVLEHIVNVDKKYGAFLESRGGRFIS